MSTERRSPELKHYILTLLWIGRIVASLAREFEPTAATIHGRIRHVEDTDIGSEDDVLCPDRVRQLERANRRLRQDNAIL